MTEFHVGDRVSVKPEHDEVLRVLGKPTGPGTITDIMGVSIIVAEDGEAEQGVWEEGGGTSAPYDPEHLVLIECRVPKPLCEVFAEEAVKEEAAWADQMTAEMEAPSAVITGHSVGPGDYEVVSPDLTGEVALAQPRGLGGEVLGATPQNVEVYPEDIDPPVNPLDIPDHYDLPMHGSILSCPKCGSDQRTEDGKVKGLRTVYHAKGVLHSPCGERFGWPDVQNLGEHLCRICERCRYGWPEAVFHGSA